jgi:uncharacterized membrane protein YkvA (DUF1232 family)
VNWWVLLVISMGGLLVLYVLLIGALVLAGRLGSAKAVATFLPDCLVLLRRLMRDPRVPRRRKFLVAGLIAYIAMPFDLIPDLIPVIGQLDDALLVALVVRSVIRGAGTDVVRELWPGPPESLAVILAVVR